MTRRRRPPPRVLAYLTPCPDCAASWQGSQLLHADTCPLAAGVDDACDGDREHFETHPEVQYYTRAITTAERQMMAHVDPAGASADHVHVLRMPGGRLRQFCTGTDFVSMALDPDEEAS